MKNDDDMYTDQAADPSWRVHPFVGCLQDRDLINDSLYISHCARHSYIHHPQGARCLHPRAQLSVLTPFGQDVDQRLASVGSAMVSD
jgi:hypothetical protein